METHLKTPQRSMELLRYPKYSGEQLRAWDAADEYILEYLGEEITLDSDSKIMIVNDSFGALTVALNDSCLSNVTDSFISQQATQSNLSMNGLSDSNVTFLNSLETSSDVFDLILIKIPKTLAFLEHLLSRLQSNISQDTQIIVAGMVKNIPRNVWKLLEKYIGPTRSSLAKKKARLIFVAPDPDWIAPPCPYPNYYILEDTNFQICNHANVFSRDSLDIGTRFLIKHLPIIPEALDIIDLGCGNGVIGLKLAETHPEANVHFVDESYMAMASAKETIENAFPERKNAFFHVSDALSHFENSADLIVCNPPFHQQYANSNQIARRMIKQSRDVLRKGGEIWVVGNRHLNYSQQMKKYFGNSTIVASNSKFVVCRAVNN